MEIPEPNQNQGPLWDRYQLYRELTDENPPKSFDEWLNG